MTYDERWVLLGSAPNAASLWKRRRLYYLLNGYKVAAVNNAWAIAGDDLTEWFLPDDFEKYGTVFPSPEQKALIKTTHMPRQTVMGYSKGTGGTMILNVLHILFNRAWENKLRISVVVIGSDFIYKPNTKNFFYGQDNTSNVKVQEMLSQKHPELVGTSADPLRYGKDWLLKELHHVWDRYKRHGSEIYNDTEELESLLPFSRIFGGEFSWPKDIKNVHYLHIPKCAGNAVKEYFKGLSPQDTSFDTIREFPKELILLDNRRFAFNNHRRLRREHNNKPDWYNPMPYPYLFSFTRNPWDRFLSTYAYLTNGGRTASIEYIPQGISFKEFVEWLGKNEECMSIIYHLYPQHLWTHVDGKFMLDFLGKQETLVKDLGSVCSHLGYKIPEALPSVNSSKHKPYQELYEDSQKAFVEKWYEKDIKLYGYSFSQ